MKKIITILFLFYTFYNFHAQSAWNIITDSLEMQSRLKADLVLSKIDTIEGEKILYSLMDKDFYIIVRNNDNYREFYISIDSLSDIINFKELPTLLNEYYYSKQKKTNKLKWQRVQEEKEAIKNAFDLEQYQTNLKKDIPDAFYTRGVLSYFVLKDQFQNRYGESSFYSLTLPCPIEPNLWVYIITKLSEQIK